MNAKQNHQPNNDTRFVLESIDDATECVIDQVDFIVVDDLTALCSIISADASDVLHSAYDLDPTEVERLKERFGVVFETPGSTRVRPWVPLDDLPYEIHTNRELALMLKATKPLAHFFGQYPDHPDVEEIPERLFDPYVEAGSFVKRQFVVPLSGGQEHEMRDVLGIRHVMYALPDQEWRINAMILLLDTAAKTGWSEALERMRGSLLGYEAWQNDIFIEKIYRKTPRTEYT